MFRLAPAGTRLALMGGTSNIGIADRPRRRRQGVRAGPLNSEVDRSLELGFPFDLSEIG
jgi:hypothetical protein